MGKSVPARNRTNRGLPGPTSLDWVPSSRGERAPECPEGCDATH